VDRTEDEDWLYRRGRYADGDASASPTGPDAIGHPASPDAAHPSRDAAHPPTEYGVPTPVGHHGPPRRAASGSPSHASQPPAASGPARAASAPPPPAGRGGAPAASGRRPRSLRRRVVTVLVVLLVYLLGVPLATWPFLDRVDATPSGERPADQPGQLFLLAGSDARDDLTPEEQAELGTGSDAGRRTDTIMLLYLPPSGKAALVSIPRDSYVAIPGHSKNKINAAYALGGPELLTATIEANTGLRVDGYAEIGFGGFVNVVDAVGGIEMCPATAIQDRDSGLDIPAGCQEMDGVTALGYVRMRKADPLGDLGRAQRQREMLGALAGKVLSPATIALPWRWWGVNSSLADSIRIGEDDGLLDLVGIGRAVVKLGTGQGLQFGGPVSNTDAQTSAGSSVLWDTKRSGALFEAMARGDGEALEAFASPR